MSRDPSLATDDRHSAAPTPPPRRIVLRFGPLPQGVPDLPYEDGVERFLLAHDVLPTWPGIAHDFPQITFKRLFYTLSPSEIAALQARAMHMRPDSFNDLMRYFSVDTPAGLDPHELLARIQDIGIVAEAYLESPPTPPPGPLPPGTAVYAQAHLDAAPLGIGARAVWSVPGAKGGSMQFADIEQGWYMHTDINQVTFVNHADLVPDPQQAPILPVTMPGWAGVCASLQSHDHGTQVMGILRALENAGGCTGIAPESNGFCVCEVRPNTLALGRADAILTAAARLGVGDVLLLEMQVTDGSTNTVQLWPVEIESGPRNAISCATAIGIVVIEASGNGPDTILGVGGLGDLDVKFATLRRGSSQFLDSGAVLVAGASDGRVPGMPVSHDRLPLTRYGSRVDCYAWGHNVETTYSGMPLTACGGQVAMNLYDPAFDGSSAASAIVAGAALVVQGIHRAHYGFPASAPRARFFLSDAALGTPSAPGAQIGVMPDLAKIATFIRPVPSPDVYMRDHLNDVGSPHTGPVSNSPDIIVRRAPVGNPTGEFGPGSGRENDDNLSQSAILNQDHFLYVRLLNRTPSASGPVEVNVYWSEVGTLITPSAWRHIGADHTKPSVIVPQVPANNVLTVSDAILWRANEVPVSGHYCFIALADCPGDPAPHPLWLADWDAFLDFIRNNNNVTWRNFVVVSGALMNAWLAGEGLAFLIAAPEEQRVRMGHRVRARERFDMRLEAEVDLAPGLGLEVEVPPELEQILGRGLAKSHGHGSPARLVIAGGRRGTISLGAGAFPAGRRWPCALKVHGAPGRPPVSGTVAIRQLYCQDDEEIEVGRVTWRFGA